MAIAPIITRLNLTLNKDDVYSFMVAPQGDGRARYIYATLYFENGELYTQTTGSTIVFEGKNSAGYNIFNLCSILGTDEPETIKIPLTNGVLSYSGLGNYRVSIYSTEGGICSFPLSIFVTEAPYDVIKLQKSDSFEALNDLISNAGEYNKWIIGENNPKDYIVSNIGDLYLDISDGDVFQNTEDAGWTKYGNIKEKTYYKYSFNSDGSDMVDKPSSLNKELIPGTTDKYKYARYVGICVSLENTAPSDYNKYTWYLFRSGLVESAWKIEYQESEDGTIVPTNDWSDTVPSIKNSNYLWTRISYVFDSDPSKIEYSYSVSRQGTSIKEVKVEYCVSDTFDVSSSDNIWNTTFPETIPNGKYLLTKTTIYDDGYHADNNNILNVLYSVMYQGVSINKIKTEYAISDQGQDSSIVTGWQSSIPVTEPGDFLWTKFIPLGNDENSTPQGDPSYTVYENVEASKWIAGTILLGESTTTGVTGVAGNKGDMYLNTETGNVYQCTESGDANNAQGNKSAVWIYRDCNVRGPIGIRGSKWYVGLGISGSSSALEYTDTSSNSIEYLAGDYYLNSGTSIYYQCIASGVGNVAKWKYVGILKGNKGDTGARGTLWFTGDQAPDNANKTIKNSANIFNNNEVLEKDLYLNTNTSNYYICDGFIDDVPTWKCIGNFLTDYNGDMKSGDFCGRDATLSVHMADTITGEYMYKKVVSEDQEIVIFPLPEDDGEYTFKVFVSDPSVCVTERNVTDSGIELKLSNHNTSLIVAIELIKRYSMNALT